MELLTNFLTEIGLTIKELEEEGVITKHDKYYYLTDPDTPIINGERIIGEGLYLGRTDNNKRFLPSPALIDLLSRKSNKKVIIDEKAEWLYLCGRDLFGKSIIRTTIKPEEEKGLVFIQNEEGENLGLGRIINPITKNQRTSKVVIKNILDKGEYLRRER